MISSSEIRYLHNTQQTQEKNIHATDGTRTRNRSNQASSDRRLRPPRNRDPHLIHSVRLKYASDIRERYSNPCTGLDRPWGFQEIVAPRYQDNRHMKVVRLSVLCTSRLYLLRNITHFWWRLRRLQRHCANGWIKSMKYSSDSNVIWTRDRPVCSAVPHPTAPWRDILYQIRISVTNYGTNWWW
jgi:hypothetical protein